MPERRSSVCCVGALALLIAILGCATAAIPSDHGQSEPLKKVMDVPLPGPAVRFDYQSLDSSQGRLYIAHLNANQLVVFDTKRKVVVANLDGLPSVHGGAAVPALASVDAWCTGG